MQFVANVYSPLNRDFEDKICKNEKNEEKRKALIKFQLDFIHAHIIGQPKNSDYKTADELSSLGYIGLYKKDDKLIKIDKILKVPDGNASDISPNKIIED